jgi:hypothetical protein
MPAFFILAAAARLHAQTINDQVYKAGVTEWSVDSSYLYIQTPNPFTFWTKNYRKNPLTYAFVTSDLTWMKMATSPSSGSSWLRGNWEYTVSGIFTAITSGPETHWGGAAAGLRYNFVPKPSNRWSPFVDFRGGVGCINASGVKYGQSRDLTFTFLIGAGVRYNIDQRSFFTIQTLTQHISNGWQTHPSQGVDLTGMAIGYGRRF